jgi:hypothetical protein
LGSAQPPHFIGIIVPTEKPRFYQCLLKDGPVDFMREQCSSVDKFFVLDVRFSRHEHLVVEV